MGIWDRLGTVIKSYIQSDGEKIFPKNTFSGDPDLNSAYEELDEYLKGKDTYKTGEGEKAKQEESIKRQKPLPEDVRQAFAELGLDPSASTEECKEAYKKLLKIHHPDRHAKHDGNLKKATEKTSRVNSSYERLMKWFRS